MTFLDVLYKIIFPFLGLILTASNIFGGFKLAKLKIDSDNLKLVAEAREKARIEETKRRDEELDKKMDNRIDIVLKENYTIKTLLNEIKDKLTLTNKRIDETNKVQELHIQEDVMVKGFKKIYWYTFNQVDHFWFVKDEKYKLLLTMWATKIEKFIMMYIENKKEKVDIYDEFMAEPIMERMIEDFYKTAESLIPDIDVNNTFRKWLEINAVHAKSTILAMEIKQNGLKPVELNKKMKRYIYEFSSTYTEVCDKWITKLEKHQREYENGEN